VSKEYLHKAEYLNSTFSHRGARNSLTVKPISPYVNGEIQNPHASQTGIAAATAQTIKENHLNNITGL